MQHTGQCLHSICPGSQERPSSVAVLSRNAVPPFDGIDAFGIGSVLQGSPQEAQGIVKYFCRYKLADKDYTVQPGLGAPTAQALCTLLECWSTLNIFPDPGNS